MYKNSSILSNLSVKRRELLWFCCVALWPANLPWASQSQMSFGWRRLLLRRWMQMTELSLRVWLIWYVGVVCPAARWWTFWKSSGAAARSRQHTRLRLHTWGLVLRRSQQQRNLQLRPLSLHSSHAFTLRPLSLHSSHAFTLRPARLDNSHVFTQVSYKANPCRSGPGRLGVGQVMWSTWQMYISKAGEGKEKEELVDITKGKDGKVVQERAARSKMVKERTVVLVQERQIWKSRGETWSNLWQRTLAMCLNRVVKYQKTSGRYGRCCTRIGIIYVGHCTNISLRVQRNSGSSWSRWQKKQLGQWISWTI